MLHVEQAFHNSKTKKKSYHFTAINWKKLFEQITFI